jgi:ABC-type antimicrobial peptide transport system permease subunit
MIVGESLWGVINGGVIGLTGLDAPFALVPADFPWMNWIGLGAFVLLIVVLYGWIMRRARAHA